MTDPMQHVEGHQFPDFWYHAWFLPRGCNEATLTGNVAQETLTVVKFCTPAPEKGNAPSAILRGTSTAASAVCRVRRCESRWGSQINIHFQESIRDRFQALLAKQRFGQ